MRADRVEQNQTIKDPETGNRTLRPNPRSEWQSADAEYLRIMPDDLFDTVQYQLAERAHVKHTNPNVHRRPKHLLSGLMLRSVGLQRLCAGHQQGGPDAPALLRAGI